MTSSPTDSIVEVSVTIAASLETVWSYFTDDAKFAAWIGSFTGMGSLPGTRVEARVGGSLRIEYPDMTGQSPVGSVAIGRIEALTPMSLAVFTWGYEKDQMHTGLAPGSSRVEVHLREQPDGVRVTLKHAGIASPQVREGHRVGWIHYLAMLARDSAQSQHATSAPVIYADYERAWSEPNDPARRALLARACEPDIQVRTGFACTNTLEALDQHIAGALKHMPGFTLAHQAPPKVSHNFAHVSWVVQAPNGQPAFSGVNVLEFSPRGLIRRLVSFPG
ncbi:MAG TPA: SRPBCC domain-containing protein [Phycisphaerales bacterium]